MSQKANHIDFSKYSRAVVKADPHKSAFLKSVVQLGQAVQTQTFQKAISAHPQKRTTTGIKTSVVSALCIYRSEWGMVPVAQPRLHLADGSWQHANNLALLLVTNDHWYGPVLEYQNLKYKGFASWGDFAEHLATIYAWTPHYERVLAEPHYADQIKLLSYYEEMPDEFHDTLFEIVKTFGLEEFDLG